MGTTYKEGLARVFLMGGLFAFSLRTPAKHEGLLLPVLLFGAILPTHHSTFLIVGSILCFVVFAFLFSQYRKAELTKQQFILQSLGYLSLFVFGIVYFVGVGGFAILLLDAQILAILLSGYFAIFGLLNLWRIRSTAKTPKFLKVVLLFLAIFGILLILANFVNIPTFPLTILPPATLLLLLPIIALGILGGFGLVSLDRVSESEQIFFSSWVYALLGLLVLALIGGLLFQFSLGLVLTYRLFIFLLAPVSALAGVGIFAYYRAHPHRSRIIQVTLVLSLLAVLPVTTVAFTRDPFFGYGCSITPAIQTSNHWLADYSTSGEVIVGDHLFTYYLLHYLERPASIERGIQLYVQNNRTTPFTFAGFHQYMLQNGFWLQTGIQWSPIHTQVPLWLMQAPSTALIYNNGIVQVFRRL
jgi:hypothetical protein